MPSNQSSLLVSEIRVFSTSCSQISNVQFIKNWKMYEVLNSSTLFVGCMKITGIRILSFLFIQAEVLRVIAVHCFKVVSHTKNVVARTMREHISLELSDIISERHQIS